MNQFEKILNLLSDNEFHCTSEFAALYMVDYRRRLGDLKEKGYQFENRRCTKHNHPMKEWKLLSEPSQSEQNAPRTIVYPKVEYCCGNKVKGLLSHSRDCKNARIATYQVKATNQLSF